MFGLSFDPAELKVGMAREEVIRRYGRPAHVHVGARSEIMFYSCGWPWTKSTIVFLEDGKVDDWEYQT